MEIGYGTKFVTVMFLLLAVVTAIFFSCLLTH